jgi:hypothetical protein
MLDFKLDLDPNPDTTEDRYHKHILIAEELSSAVKEMESVTYSDFSAGKRKPKEFYMSSQNWRGKYSACIIIDKVLMRGISYDNKKCNILDDVMEPDTLPVVKMLHASFPKLGVETITIVKSEVTNSFYVSAKQGDTLLVFDVTYTSLASPVTMALRNIETSDEQIVRFFANT